MALTARMIASGVAGAVSGGRQPLPPTLAICVADSQSAVELRFAHVVASRSVSGRAWSGARVTGVDEGDVALHLGGDRCVAERAAAALNRVEQFE
mgnify:CR=1 FL=1